MAKLPASLDSAGHLGSRWPPLSRASSCWALLCWALLCWLGTFPLGATSTRTGIGGSATGGPEGRTATTPRVTGHLVDGQGRDVAGAHVSLLPWISPYEQALLELNQQNDPAPVVRAVSGRDGLFDLQAPAGGPTTHLWRLRVDAAGFVPQERPLLPWLDDLDLPTLRLEPAVPRRVQLRGSDGRALRGARIVLQSQEVRQAWTRAVRSGWTGRGGRLRLDAGLGESLHLAAWAKGFQETVLTYNGETGHINGRLQPAVPRGLRVLDPTGSPAAAVVVRIGSGEWPTGITDARGYLRLFIAIDGETPVLVEDAHGRRARGLLQPAPDKAGIETPHTLTLEAPWVVSGRVLDARGVPIAGALVWSAALPAFSTRSGGKGDFQLPVPRRPGNVTTVFAAATGFRPRRDQVQHAPAADGAPRDPPLELRLHPSRSAEGVVVDADGTGIANASVYALRTVGNLDQQATRSLDGGIFRLTGLHAEGSYDIVAQAPGYARALAVLPSPRAQARQPTLRLVLRRGLRAVGTVADTDGLPIPDAEVRLRPNSGTPAVPSWGQGRAGSAYRASTGEQGAYQFQHLNPGRYNLEADAPGYAPTRVRGIEIPEGQEVNDLGTILLEPGVTLFGRIVDIDEQPLAGVSIKAHAASSFRAKDQRGNFLTDEDGRFRFDDLRAGERLDLQIERNGYLDETVHGVEVPLDATLEVTLRRSRYLTGRLLSTDGQPMPDATVLLAPLEGTFIVGRQPIGVATRHGTADEETGLFEVSDLLPGRYQLRASAPGYLEREQDVEIPAEGTAEHLELRLDRGATLTGTVRNADGLSLPGILVQRLGDGGPPSPFDNDARQRSGEDGSYKLTGLAAGRHEVEARHGNFLRSVHEVELSPGGVHHLDFELRAGASLSGEVTDEAGTAISGAHLLISGASNYKVVYSDAEGRFQVSGLGEGDFRVRGSHPDYATTELPQPVQLRGASVDGITLVLQRGGSVRGQVLGLGFDELADTNVWATGPGGTIAGSMDFEGQYRIEALSAGAWTVMASVAGDQRYASARIELVTGEEGYVDIEFKAGFVVSGRVMHRAQPVTGAPIRLFSDDDVFSGGTAVTDYQGRFAVDHVEPGVYQLRVLHTGEGLNYSEGIDVFGDLDLEIEVPDQKLRGRVVDATDGRPIDRALLRLSQIGGRPSNVFPSAYSGPDGSFEISGLSAGDWRLQADRDGYASASVDVEIGPGFDTEGLELRLGPASGLTLRILLPTGRPADYAAVALLDAQGRPVSAEARNTGENGRFHLERAPAGTWTVVVTSYGISTVVTATAPGPVVPVDLPAAGSLELRVPSLEDSQALLRLRGADGQPFRTASASGVRDHWLLRQGRLNLNGVPAGTWMLEISTADGTTRTHTVQLRAGERQSVELP